MAPPYHFGAHPQRRRRATTALLALLAVPAAAAAATPDLTELSLEELMTIEVTSTAKRPERLTDAAAAVFVLTDEDIRRSGATSIPELLRLVPGVEVARINAATWAITARGFNSRFANKLLVLVDGRSVYTPLFSGVFWDRQDVLLEDIDRIEVIRGPGASLWGANAVNGVVNIITKPASKTQGNLVKLAAGVEERGFAAARHGGTVGDDVHYRVYAKGFSRDGGPTAAGREAADDWQAGRVGFRIDGAADARDSWQLQGDVYRGGFGETFPLATLTAPYSETRDGEIDAFGGFLLGRWERRQSDASQISVQAYVDHNAFDDVRLESRRSTVDLEFEHDLRVGDRHRVVWGVGHRVGWDSLDGTFAISFDPDSETMQLTNAFVQDTIELVPQTLELTVGSKFEHNTFTGFEVQPTARALWHVDGRNTVWAAVSRAVRTPSRGERDVRLNNQVIPPLTTQNPATVPALVATFGSDQVEAEDLTAYELGYRLRAGETLSFDLAAFYNRYDDLIGVRQAANFLETSPQPTHVVVPFVVENGLAGEAYGVEAVANWQALPAWRLQLAYSLIDLDVRVTSDAGRDSRATDIEGKSPRHQASLRSLTNLADDVTFDVTLRYVDDLPAVDVDAYLTFDARLGWRPTDDLELALVGRNLLGSHFEFGSEATLPTEPTKVEPSVFATVRWTF